MKPIEKPVCRPTVNSIWNSFRNSGKRHLFLTGSRGSGKTTLLSKLFPEKLPGLTTWAEPQKAVYMKDNKEETAITLARYDGSNPDAPTMVLCSDGFVSFGVPALERCSREDSQWIRIDEIGFLEGTCEPYKDALRKLLEQKQVAAVLRKQDLPFLNELRDRNDVFLVDLDEPYRNCGCIIMASGLGKRFGGNKLMENFLGHPLITRILDTTDGIFRKRVVVTRHESVAALCKARNVDVILHDLPHRSDTVRLGMEALGTMDCCMFCPGDQPLLRKDTILSLLLCSANSPDAIWRAGFEHIPGSPALFPEWTFPELETLPEGKGGGWVIGKYPEKTSLLSVSDRFELMDIDTPEDLEHLESCEMKRTIMKDLIIVRGGGDLATGTIYKLKNSGFPVLVLETDHPSAIRRHVAFSEAVYEGSKKVEQMTCYLAESLEQAVLFLQEGKLTMLVDPHGAAISALKPMAVVDAILAKKNLGTSIDMAPITIGLGPDFTAGHDVDVVIETQRGHHLGRILRNGSAAPNTGIPGVIEGYGKERVVYSPAAGILKTVREIGDTVLKGDTIALIETENGSIPVAAALSGLLRGLIRNDFPVPCGFKIADIDPRLDEYENCFTISDKARCIAGGVLEAILQMKGELSLW